jgi:hypothetical protein
MVTVALRFASAMSLFAERFAHAELSEADASG